MTLDKEAKQHLINVRSEAIRQGRWPTCTNCQYWQEVTEVVVVQGVREVDETYYICNKFRTHPPESVIVVGCINHEPEVPF